MARRPPLPADRKVATASPLHPWMAAGRSGRTSSTACWPRSTGTLRIWRLPSSTATLQTPCIHARGTHQNGISSAFNQARNNPANSVSRQPISHTCNKQVAPPFPKKRPFTNVTLFKHLTRIDRINPSHRAVTPVSFVLYFPDLKLIDSRISRVISRKVMGGDKRLINSGCINHRTTHDMRSISQLFIS